MFKCLNGNNLKQVYYYVVDFWEGTADYWEWHAAIGVLVPKKGDLSNPNKWQGINLMDVCSNISSSIMNVRLFMLLEHHGIKTQFGGTPGIGCQDGSFTMKTVLHQRHQHNLPLCVAFVDLVKDYDTVNHKLLIEVLKRYGAPPKLCSAIERLYADLLVVLQIGKEKAEILQTVGVRQGDNFSPVLFMFLVSTFAESLETD